MEGTWDRGIGIPVLPKQTLNLQRPSTSRLTASYPWQTAAAMKHESH